MTCPWCRSTSTSSSFARHTHRRSIKLYLMRTTYWTERERCIKAERIKWCKCAAWQETLGMTSTSHASGGILCELGSKNLLDDSFPAIFASSFSRLSRHPAGERVSTGYLASVVLYSNRNPWTKSHLKKGSSSLNQLLNAGEPINPSQVTCMNYLIKIRFLIGHHALATHSQTSLHQLRKTN